MGDQLDIILVPHTHWDREWYQTFQQFRIRLVRTIDKLLDILDRDDKFQYFMLDGQTIVLDDYLEVRPEQEERLKKYTQTGRIQVGPWYLQPDEFLVSGEALIRNLQIGLQRAAEFATPMRIGYVPDCFGHIAQLPQILRGFGIDNAVFWRGVGSDAHKSEFYWAAPDGTRVLVIHLAAPVGYSNARMMPLAAPEFATRVELLTAQLLPKATTNMLLFMNGSDHLEPQDGLPATIEAANTLLAHIKPEHEKLLADLNPTQQQNNNRHFDSIHVRIGTLSQYVDAIRQSTTRSASPNAEQAPPLQTLSGEMRSSQYAHLLPAVLSTRMWIKQQNTLTEHLLEKWVEPLTAWAWQLGAPYPAGLVKLAWKYLLQNHPHDSICGCSIDQVHRENAVRFAQSQQIAEGVIAQAMQTIAAAVATHAPIPTSHASHSPVPIVVFNPAPGPRTEVVRVGVQFSGSLRKAAIIDEQSRHMPYTVVSRWRQEIGSMPFAREAAAYAVALAGINAPGQALHMMEGLIATTLGQPEEVYSIARIHIDLEHEPGIAHIEVMVVPAQQSTGHDHDLLAAEQQFLTLVQREDIHTLTFTLVDQVHETIEFVAADLPAYGLKTFWMYPRGLTDEANPAPTTTLLSEERAIENEWYRIEASPSDGTLSVTDKRTGAVFTGLNRFVDGGDVGDLYTYCPPAQDTLVSQPVEPPTIEVITTGSVRVALRISGRWSLPTSCAASRTERSGRSTICQIVSEVSLTLGSRRVDIHTSVDNHVKDHRLRVLFPVPYSVEHVASEGTFEVRMRPVAVSRPADTEDWAEEPVNTFPQKRFVDISNGSIGLGVLNRGLPEYEILSSGPGIEPGHMAVALTLLRCVEWLSRGDLATRRGHAGPMELTPEAQCQGRQEFDYALVPHSGDWEAKEALVLREAQNLHTPVRSLVLPAAASEGHAEEQQKVLLSSCVQLLEVEPRELVVSAIKRSNSGKGMVVRVYNPLAHAVEAALRPGLVFSQAFVANLQEELQEQLLWTGEEEKVLHVGVRSGEIKTIMLL
jgi:mannosylglycerate hydrolase